MGKIEYTLDVNEMCSVRKGCDHGHEQIPKESL